MKEFFLTLLLYLLIFGPVVYELLLLRKEPHS